MPSPNRTIVVSVGHIIREVDRQTLVLFQQTLVDVFSVLKRDLGTVSIMMGRAGGLLSTPIRTSFPGQPIHVNDMVFLQPDNAETRPPDDIYQ